jgi:hypothetical protein
MISLWVSAALGSEIAVTLGMPARVMVDDKQVHFDLGQGQGPPMTWSRARTRWRSTVFSGGCSPR